MTTRRPSIIAELFGEQVRAHPDRIALVRGETRLSYRDLDRASDQLAAHLHERGIGAERVVGIALPRSERCAIAWLAVAKVNGVCLWLDPDYPDQRLADMVEAAAPQLLLTLEAHRDQVGAVAGGAAVICLDALGPAELPQAGPRASEESASYIIFTSGSTGKPKGTVLTGTGVASLRETAVRGLGVGGESRVLQFTSMSFDVAFFEMVMSLLVGGRLVVVPSEQRVADGEFWDLLRAEGVTHACLPPAFLELLPETGIPEPLTVITGADKVPTELARRWARRCRVITAYGVTEATVNSTLWAFDPAWDSPVAPIGSADPGTAAHVLDEDLREVPDGEPGELYLAGDGLARGYLDQPGLTAARFVPNPFGTGDRMYRTGDRVVRSPGGVLEFLGRMDAQIKVRGHRIEPTEVESALLGHPSVAQAVVSAPETTPGSAQLVAHVVGADGTRPDARELRQHLAELVPRYMIPSTVVVVDRLVSLPNGKIDRRALPPVPEIARGAELRDILAEELGELPANGELDFVASGGHSLSAMRLVARIREQLGWRLSVRDFFDARRVDDLVRRESGVAEPAPSSRDALSPGQERLWLVEQLGDAGPLYAVPWVWRVSGDFDVHALRSALRTVVARHDVLRTRYPVVDGVPVREVLESADPDFDVIDPDDVDRAVDDAVREGFDLAARPPLRVRVLRAGEQEWVVVVCLHHIATDDWSVNALAQELGRCYRGRLLPGTPAQQADSVVGTTAESEAFWRRALAGAPEEMPLPRDRPRPEVASFRGALLTRAWSAERLAGLRELVRDSGSSLFVVVHALIASTLAERGAGPDVVVGAPVAGRDDPRTYSAQGFFVNTVVLRTVLGGDEPFSRVLARVREADLAALSHQDVPFSTVVEQLNPRRHAARNPLFQVMVAQQHHADVVPDLGLDVRAVPVDKGTAEFDLGFAFMAGESGITFKVEYSTDLFDEATVAGILDRLDALADAVLSGADPVVRPVALDTGSPTLAGEIAPAPSRGALDLVIPLYEEVLGTSGITAEDDFFSLGGHSLSAMRLVAALRSRHGIDVRVSALFTHPAVGEFAARIERADRAEGSLRPAERGTTAPLSFGQEQLWLFEQLGEGFDGYGESWIWRVSGDLDAERLRSAVLRVVDRHEVLRTRYPLVDGSPVQEVLPPGSADVDVLTEPTEDLLDVLAGGSFDLAETPPLRVRILRIGAEWLVAWSMHHIAIDDWSIGLLATEVGAAYRGDDLPALPVQYADHALHQRRLAPARTGAGAELRGLPVEVTLPGDRARPDESSHQGSTETRRITAELRRVAEDNGVTTYMVLHAALAAVLAESGAGDDITIGCPVSGRDDEATHSLVGFFVNTVVLRCDLGGNPAFSELLRRVRDADLDAFGRGDVPFAHLVEAVNPSRHPSRNPLFQVMLAQQHHSAALPDLGGPAVDLVRMPVDTAQFDLSLGFSETSEGISLNVEYATDLYDRDTALGFVDRFEALLQRVAAGEDPVIRPTERAPVAEAAPAPAAAVGAAVGDVGLIVRLFGEVLESPEVAPGDDFFDLGGHSLTAIRLINRIEEATGTRIPVRALLKARTAEAVAAAVDAKAGRA